jgi:hypothetical protein
MTEKPKKPSNVVKVDMGSGKVRALDLANAKPSCRSCYGTGRMGTRVERDGSRVPLLCPCVIKRSPAEPEPEKKP